MYRCEVCQETSQPREKMELVVTQTRPATYPYRRNVFFDKDAKRYYDDPGGAGRETVTEIRAHEMCAVGMKLALTNS